MAASTPVPRDPYRQYRLFDFAVDKAWVRKHNENQSEIRRLQVSAVILALILVAVGVGFVFWADQEPWGWMALAALGVVALAIGSMTVVIPKKMGSMEHTYATSELVPAMIADVRARGVTLMALVDQSVDRSKESVPALAVRSAEQIPGLDKPKVGDRVPAVAVVGNRSATGRDNLYQFVSPLPIAWGTSDVPTIRRAEEEIPAGEWERLRQNIGRHKEVEQTPTNLLAL